jgi:NADH dehydrogenase [ubiquinone] 1 alpha subcomplex assembly factor 7
MACLARKAEASLGGVMKIARKSHGPKSTLLAARLKERIARNGPISVAEYMEACLADKYAGYYPSRQPIGADGDFITAPEVSQVFGELLGLWAVAVWQSMDAPKPVTVAELGPGRGSLMADALRAWRTVPDFAASVMVALVETSPVLREVQRTALYDADVPVKWYDSVGALPSHSLIFIANEFVDALPVRQLVWRERSWRERCVNIAAEGGFAFCEGPPVENERLRQAGEALKVPDGSILEIRPGTNALISALATHAQIAPLAGLIVDYGHTETTSGDTLQAVSRHKFADPLDAPGEADLTAHVDFAALKDAAARQGLLAYGPMPQGEFLLKLGLEARRDRLCKTATLEQCQEILSATNRLVDPAAMGVLFKALALTSPGLAPPPPFEDI